MLNYIINRTKRKTIAIYVRRDGEVEVKAPIRCSDLEIEKLISDKKDWIEDARLKILNNINISDSFILNKGDTISLLNNDYIIEYGEKVLVEGNIFFIPKGEFLDVKPQIIKYLKKYAKSAFIKRLDNYSHIMGVAPINVKISSAKTRWGSCSYRNSINLNYRLIFANYFVLDYLIVHELAHIIEKNHSRSFWALVEKTLPDYKKRKAELKILEKKLKLEGWW